MKKTLAPVSLKVCLYRTRSRPNAEHDFSLFYLDQRCQAAFAVAFCINRPLNVRD